MKFEKRLTLQVSVQIIKHISSGLYRSPASALKELISNSFDADATDVSLNFHFSYDRTGTIFLDRIAVRDNGNGMDLRTLEYIFTHIGGSTKNEKNREKTPSGRDTIGRLGIGMLSVASACRSFVVRTKKQDEEREYSAEISLSFFDDVREQTETMDKFSIGNVKVTSRSVLGFDKYTIVEISDFKPPFLSNILDDIQTSYFFQVPFKLNSEESEESQFERYFTQFLDGLSYDEKLPNLAVFDQIIATVGLMSPVQYLPDGPVRSKITLTDGTEHIIPGTSDPNFISLKEKIRNLNFNAKIGIFKSGQQDNEMETHNYFKIYKPLLYPTKRDLLENSLEKLNPYVYVIEPKEAEIENEPGLYINTLIRGYVYHQNVRILPHEYRGILFRVYNVAIGDYFKDELRLYSEDPVVLHQMLVEIYLDKGFHSIVNLDRESLFEGSRTYQYLRAYLENLFRGKVPERPPIKQIMEKPNNNQDEVIPLESRTKEINILPSKAEVSFNRDITFYNNLSKILPEKKGIISDIKERRAERRKEIRRTMDPTSNVRRVAKQVLGGGKIEIAYSTTLDEFGLIVQIPDSNEWIISIPKFSGSRAKTWESIFTAASLWAPKDSAERIKFMDTLYSIYITSEGKQNES